jgi:hypothetical protein
VGALLITACGSSSSATSSHPATTKTTPASTSHDARGPEGIPLESGPALASPSATTPGAAVDGIKCAPVEQLAYHIHAHLQVYVDGQSRSLPGAIGLVGPAAQQTPYGSFYGATQCYYWLHTHASDGVIHIESPTQRIYTLGDFFDEWRQPLSADQVASAKGAVTAFFNGQRWTKSPRALPLQPHAVIQLDVGAPVVPFATTSWADTNL